MFDFVEEFMIEAGPDRRLILHKSGQPPVNIPGYINLRDLLVLCRRLAATPPQAIPVPPNTPLWARPGKPFRDKYPKIPGKHSWNVPKKDREDHGEDPGT